MKSNTFVHSKTLAVSPTNASSKATESIELITDESKQSKATFPKQKTSSKATESIKQITDESKQSRATFPKQKTSVTS